MSITLTYEPDKGIFYEGKFVSWGTKREIVRETFQGEYKIHDQEFADIVSHRDIYNRLASQSVLLFLNYDKNDLFYELEIHNGIELNIFNKKLNFEMQFWDAVDTLNDISFSEKIVDAGEVLFIDLKISLCSAVNMGGEQNDNGLSYIYCAQDVGHLLE